MLRACGRILRPGGRIGFLTIRVADGLSPSQRRRTIAAAPPAPTGPDGHDLAERSGFVDIHAVDVTDEYLEVARAWFAARVRLRDELRALDPSEYDERIARSTRAIPEIAAGRLRRVFVVARKPSG